MSDDYERLKTAMTWQLTKFAESEKDLIGKLAGQPTEMIKFLDGKIKSTPALSLPYKVFEILTITNGLNDNPLPTTLTAASPTDSPLSTPRDSLSGPDVMSRSDSTITSLPSISAMTSSESMSRISSDSGPASPAPAASNTHLNKVFENLRNIAKGNNMIYPTSSNLEKASTVLGSEHVPQKVGLFGRVLGKMKQKSGGGLLDKIEALTPEQEQALNSAKAARDALSNALLDTISNISWEKSDTLLKNAIEANKALASLPELKGEDKTSLTMFTNKLLDLQDILFTKKQDPGAPLRSYFEAFLIFLETQAKSGTVTFRDWSTLVNDYVDKHLKKFKYASKTELRLLLELTLGDQLVYNNVENTLNLMSMLENKFKANLGVGKADEESFLQYKSVIQNLVAYMKKDPSKSSFPGRKDGETYDVYQTRRRKFISDFVDTIYSQDGDAITPGTPMGQPNKGFVGSQHEAAMNFLKGIFDERITAAFETAKNPEAKRKLMGALEEVRVRRDQEEKALKTIQYKLTGLPVPLDTPEDGWKNVIKTINAEAHARGIPSNINFDYNSRGGAAPIAIEPFQSFVDSLLKETNVKQLLDKPDLLKKFFEENKGEITVLLADHLGESINTYLSNPENVKPIVNQITTGSTDFITNLTTALANDPTLANKVAAQQVLLNGVIGALDTLIESKVNGKMDAKVAEIVGKILESLKKTDDPTRAAIEAALIEKIKVPEADVDVVAGKIDLNRLAQALTTTSVGTSTPLQQIIDKAAEEFLKDSSAKNAFSEKLTPQFLKENITAVLPEQLAKLLSDKITNDSSVFDAFKKLVATEVAAKITQTSVEGIIRTLLEQYGLGTKDLIVTEIINKIIGDQTTLIQQVKDEIAGELTAGINTNIANLEAKVTEAVLTNLEERLKRLEESITKLNGMNDSIAELRTRLDTFEATNLALQERLAAFDQEKAELLRKHEELLAAGRTADAEAVNAQARQLDALKAETAAQKKALEDEKTRITAEYTVAVNALNGRLTEWQNTQKADFERTINNFTTTLETLRKTSGTVSEGQLAPLKEQIAEQIAKNDALVRQLTEASESAAASAVQAAEQVAQNNTASDSAKAAQAAAEAARAAAEKAGSDAARIATEKAALVTENAELKALLEKLNTEGATLSVQAKEALKSELDGIINTKTSEFAERIQVLEEMRTDLTAIANSATAANATALQTLEQNISGSINEKVSAAVKENLATIKQEIGELRAAVERAKSGSNENLAVLVKGMIGVTHPDETKRTAALEEIERVWPKRATGTPVPGAGRGGADVPAPASGASAAATPDVAPLPKDNAKKQIGTLDQVKKEVRGILDALDGIQKMYTDTFAKFFKEDEDTKKKREAAAAATAADADAAAKVKKSANATQQVKVEISPEDQNILGSYKTLQDDGQKWVKEVEDSIQTKKKAIENVLKLLQSVFDTEPANKKYIDYGAEVKRLFEGDYQAEKGSKQAKGLLTLMQSISQEIKSIYENRIRELKPQALAVEQKIQLEKEKLQAVARSSRGNQGFNGTGGSTKRPSKKMHGGVDPEFPAAITYIQDELNKVVLQKIVKDLDGIYLRQSNPVMAAAVSEPSIFAGIYNDYLDRRNKMGSFVASKELSQQLHNNALIPREVLAVSKLDKTVFVFVTLFIRLFALTIAEYMIERGVINTMPKSLAVFVGLYLVIFLAFVVLVNLDVYRMRIIFNYVNFHANSGLVYSHVGMLVMFTIIIYIIMRNVNFPVEGIEVTAITDEEKSSLIYRLEILTMIVWLFLVILIAVM